MQLPTQPIDVRMICVRVDNIIYLWMIALQAVLLVGSLFKVRFFSNHTTQRR